MHLIFIGYGVFTKNEIHEGTLICIYHGELLNAKKEGKERDSNYLFYFSMHSKHYWYVEDFMFCTFRKTNNYTLFFTVVASYGS